MRFDAAKASTGPRASVSGDGGRGASAFVWRTSPAARAATGTVVAGQEEHVDAAGEDRPHAGERVLVVDRIVAGRQNQPRRAVGDEDGELIAGAEKRDRRRVEIPQPERKGRHAADERDDEDDQRRGKRLSPASRLAHGWPSSRNGDGPRLRETLTIRPAAAGVSGGGSCVTMAFSGTVSENTG
jgi:hypothetical protein